MHPRKIFALIYVVVLSCLLYTGGRMAITEFVNYFCPTEQGR
jgi:hypothetical protein